MERLDRARVRDVVEGWVPAPGAEMGSQEFERALRKTAQRGGEYAADCTEPSGRFTQTHAHAVIIVYVS